MALASAKRKSRQAACVNNLHQIGLGFTGFALEHEGKYQMDVPERFGGSMEFNDSRLIENTPFSRDYHHFWVLSNELPNVKTMVCPADRRRKAAENYQTFANENQSYWANTKAQPHATLSTLAGDWNVSNTGSSSNDLAQISFGREVHQRRGSVLFADGRVEITRSLVIATPAAPDSITVATTGKPQPPITAGAPGARPQPASATPPPAVPVASPSPESTARSSSPPPSREKNPTIRPTNDLTTVTTSTGIQFGNRRILLVGGGGGADAPSSQVGQTQPVTVNGAGAPSTGGEEEEPWDTPGFRLFKTLAFLSYLISLLWALVALLLLYLKSRLAQRAEEERTASINVD